MSIPNPSVFYCKEIEKPIFSFIWNGSTHRIKRDVLVQKYEEGGLKITRKLTSQEGPRYDN